MQQIAEKNYLQAEQRHSAPFQDRIRLLKCKKLFSVLKWFGRLFHNVAAANPNDFLPYLVDFTCGTSRMFEYLKEYFELFTFTKFCKHTGAILFTILNVSIAIVRIRLICREGTLAFCRRSS